jgi:hypothetical protein
MKAPKSEQNRKKLVAALTAVAYHIHSEQEIIASQMAQGPPTTPSLSTAGSSIKLWGASGRQDQMQLRMQMQLKAFHGYQKRTV